MVNLDPMQEAALVQFERDYSDYRTARETLEQRLRVELERKLLELRVVASLAGNRAVAAGVPLVHLGLKSRNGMRIKHHGTIRAFLDETRALSTEAPVDAENPGGERFAFDHETQTLTITATEADREQFERAHWGGLFGWSWVQISTDPSLQSAEFKIAPFGLDPITVDFMPERADRHPVVALYTSGDEQEHAALEWVRKHPGFAKEAA